MTTATAYTFDENVVSDLHKDAYGFRPGESFWEYWTASDDARKQRIWDDLCDALEREMEYQREQEARAVEEFNSMLKRLYETGANNYEQALEWTHESYDTNGDDEYLEYKLGLPYGYIRWTKQGGE